jgi:hypothetical protein
LEYIQILKSKYKTTIGNGLAGLDGVLQVPATSWAEQPAAISGRITASRRAKMGLIAGHMIAGHVPLPVSANETGLSREIVRQMYVTACLWPVPAPRNPSSISGLAAVRGASVFSGTRRRSDSARTHRPPRHAAGHGNFPECLRSLQPKERPMLMTYRQALAAFDTADQARKAAWNRLAEAQRVLGHARSAFDLADEDRTVAGCRVDDAYRRQEHAAGRPVTADTKPATDERTAPC